MTQQNRVPLPGSEKQPVAGAEEIGEVHPDERLEVTIRLRRRAEQDLSAQLTLLAAKPPEAREHLTREAYAERHGADPADIAKVEAFARANGLSVVETSAARQSVVLAGTVTGVNGQGQCVAILELGGGFRAADLRAYFQQLHIPQPKVVAVSVDHGRNQPSGPNSADGEVMLDIDVVGSVAPGARIAVYFAPNTDQGFIDAITTAVHDTTNCPSVISISWGAPEGSW